MPVTVSGQSAGMSDSFAVTGLAGAQQQRASSGYAGTKQAERQAAVTKPNDGAGNCSSRLLKNSPRAAGLMSSVGFLWLWAAGVGVRDPLAAGLGAYCAVPGHHVGASARSLGSLTRL